ncbi:hypothetical protein, partial [Variovorax atrisoli]|uniref:hypothetical protein n=1 Tax=Variovorax atrisoli TaxID=3394203 RepID=UPI003F827983
PGLPSRQRNRLHFQQLELHQDFDGVPRMLDRISAQSLEPSTCNVQGPCHVGVFEANRLAESSYSIESPRKNKKSPMDSPSGFFALKQLGIKQPGVAR